MERLTERETRMVNSFDKDENYKAELYNRLAAYEDADEQGRLVRLNESERKEFDEWRKKCAEH